MSIATISQALTTLEELRHALNDAYWEVSKVHQKDVLFDIICSLHEELNELAKLSINDHSMPYEAVTHSFKGTQEKFTALSKKLDQWFSRTKTQTQLKQNLNNAGLLLNS